MRVEILQVPDCPNAALLAKNLREARIDDITHHVIEDLETATAMGMTGSPTLLIDGTDPFAAGEKPSVSCRLYENGVPSVAALRRVLP
jgi:hypothetical protein